MQGCSDVVRMPVTSLRYPTPWPNFALDWSPNSPNFCTLGVASFVPSLNNQVYQHPYWQPIITHHLGPDYYRRQKN